MLIFCFSGQMKYICRQGIVANAAPAGVSEGILPDGKTRKFRAHSPYHTDNDRDGQPYLCVQPARENKQEDPCKRWYWLSGSSCIIT